MVRFFDIFFATIAILLLSPLLIPVMMILRFTGEGEIFFSQERNGRYGNSFKLLKFATMLKNSPNMFTGTITTKNDPRILPFGKFLRKSKINELPQLLNILRGDMSIVGPRPLTLQTFSSYSGSIQATVASVRPGLTGIGSIVFRNEEDILQGEHANAEFYNNIIAPYKGQLEEWFVQNNNLYNYFIIILCTAAVVIVPKSQIIWSVFSDLPKPPKQLSRYF